MYSVPLPLPPLTMGACARVGFIRKRIHNELRMRAPLLSKIAPTVDPLWDPEEETERRREDQELKPALSRGQACPDG
jgi:hypothetical protein